MQGIEFNTTVWAARQIFSAPKIPAAGPYAATQMTFTQGVYDNMKQLFSLTAALLLMAGMTALPTASNAQDKTGKMSGDKMGGKMSGGKMDKGAGLSGAALQSKAMSGLTDDQKKYVSMKMMGMSDADKMAMEKKLAGYSTSVKKGQVTKMMNKDKKGAGGAPGDKMGGKMGGGKM